MEPIRFEKVIPRGQGLAKAILARAIELKLPFDVRNKSRFSEKLSNGHQAHFFLPRGNVLVDGDILIGDDAANKIDGGIGNDNIIGGGGNDTLVGGNDNDTLQGGVGDDTLTGGAGDDTLIGGACADKQDGGAGSDLYIIGSAADYVGDVIRDSGVPFITSGESDELRFTSTIAGDTLNLGLILPL